MSEHPKKKKRLKKQGHSPRNGPIEGDCQKEGVITGVRLLRKKKQWWK